MSDPSNELTLENLDRIINGLDETQPAVILLTKRQAKQYAKMSGFEVKGKVTMKITPRCVWDSVEEII